MKINYVCYKSQIKSNCGAANLPKKANKWYYNHSVIYLTLHYKHSFYLSVKTILFYIYIICIFCCYGYYCIMYTLLCLSLSLLSFSFAPNYIWRIKRGCDEAGDLWSPLSDRNILLHSFGTKYLLNIPTMKGLNLFSGIGDTYVKFKIKAHVVYVYCT